MISFVNLFTSILHIDILFSILVYLLASLLICVVEIIIQDLKNLNYLIQPSLLLVDLFSDLLGHYLLALSPCISVENNLVCFKFHIDMIYIYIGDAQELCQCCLIVINNMCFTYVI